MELFWTVGATFVILHHTRCTGEYIGFKPCVASVRAQLRPSWLVQIDQLFCLLYFSEGPGKIETNEVVVMLLSNDLFFFFFFWSFGVLVSVNFKGSQWHCGASRPITGRRCGEVQFGELQWSPATTSIPITHQKIKQVKQHLLKHSVWDTGPCKGKQLLLLSGKYKKKKKMYFT